MDDPFNWELPEFDDPYFEGFLNPSASDAMPSDPKP